MRTRKGYRSLGTLALLGAAAVLLAATGVARAQVGSDLAAGILVFPKIAVDTVGRLTGGIPVDTVVEIANTDPTEIRSLHCFWVNANSYCNGDVDIANLCDPNSDNPVLNCRETGRRCLPAWRVTDFFVAATANQPIGFRVGQVPQSALPCLPGNTNGCAGNDGSINPVEDPFTGELKCVEVNDLTNVVPVNRNDFTGTARIYRVTPSSVDVRQYNAIGIQSIADPNAGPNDATTLCLGTDTNGASPVCSAGAEYASCPSTLVVNHFFEGAAPFGDGATVNTTLTLVPCTERIEDTTGVNSVTGQQVTNAQLAIVNEFEQRFSSATRVDCYKSMRLSDLDTRPGTTDDGSSIFSVGVEGSLTGQTRVRGVPGQSPYHGLLGLAEESYSNGFSAAFNVNYDGVRPAGAGDVITVP